MEKPKSSNQFEINTMGSCFICYKKILNVKTNCAGTQLSSDNQVNLSSLQAISRYLNFNMENVFTTETTSIPSQLLHTLQRAELKVPLCGNCETVVGKFNLSLKELDDVKVQLNYCLRTVQEKLLEAEKDELAKKDYWDGMVNNPQALIHVGIVEKLRKEAIEKSTSKMNRILPFVPVKRLDSRQLSKPRKKAKLHTAVSAVSTPISPVVETFDIISQEDETETPPRVDNGKKVDKRKHRVIKVRRIMMSSSSESESDKDEKVKQETKYCGLSETESNMLEPEPVPTPLVLSSTRLKATSSSEESSSTDEDDDAHDNKPFSSFNNSVTSTSRDLKDDPVKRLYPFKCTTCRKRFKTADNYKSHSHLGTLSSSPSKLGSSSIPRTVFPLEDLRTFSAAQVNKNSPSHSISEKTENDLTTTSTRKSPRHSQTSEQKSRSVKGTSSNSKKGPNFRCTYCHETFPTEILRRKHIKILHPDSEVCSSQQENGQLRQQTSTPVHVLEDGFKIELMPSSCDEDDSFEPDVPEVHVTEEVDLKPDNSDCNAQASPVLCGSVEIEDKDMKVVVGGGGDCLDPLDTQDNGTKYKSVSSPAMDQSLNLTENDSTLVIISSKSIANNTTTTDVQETSMNAPEDDKPKSPPTTKESDSGEIICVADDFLKELLA